MTTGSTGRRALKVGLVSVVTLVAFESLAVTTILPEVESDLGGIAWYGWVTAAFFLGTMIGIVFAGEQADRRGAGPPYLLGLVLFAIGLLVCGFAPGMPVLVVGRFVQGFGAGVVPAIGYVAIGRAFDVDERPRMFAILSTAWVVPGLIGPVLAERIAEGIGWRWVFLGLVPLVACAGLFVLPAIFRIGPVEGAAPTDRVPFMRRRLVEATRVAAGVALVVAGFTASRWLLLPTLVAGALVAIGPFSRLTPAGTLRGAPGLPAVIASRGVLTFAFFATDAFVPFAVITGRGMSSLAGSVAVTVGTVAWTSATWVQQRFIVRMGEAWFVRSGYVLMVPGIVLVGVAAIPDLLPFWFIHVGVVVAGFGMGLAYSAHAQLALRSVPESEVGSATASLQLTDNLGIALGTGAVGAIVTFGDESGWALGDAVAVALILPACVAMLGVVLSRRLPATGPGRRQTRGNVGRSSGGPDRNERSMRYEDTDSGRRAGHRRRIAGGCTGTPVEAVPAGFVDVAVVPGAFASPTAVKVLPGGELLVLEKGGSLRRVAIDGTVSLAGTVNVGGCAGGERGLLSAALDPSFATTGIIYIYATRPVSGGCANTLSKFTLTGTGLTGEQVLIDNIAWSATNHNGGTVEVGRDGHLYLSVGEGAVTSRAQSLASLGGKILRITTTGEPAPGNPFLGAAGHGRCARIGQAARSARRSSRSVCATRSAWRSIRTRPPPGSASTTSAKGRGRRSTRESSARTTDGRRVKARARTARPSGAHHPLPPPDSPNRSPRTRAATSSGEHSCPTAGGRDTTARTSSPTVRRTRCGR